MSLRQVFEMLHLSFFWFRLRFSIFPMNQKVCYRALLPLPYQFVEFKHASILSPEHDLAKPSLLSLSSAGYHRKLILLVCRIHY